jgi:phosphoribosylanthranilate isomerase
MQTYWIKICGMTTLEAVHAALTAKVDAVGFVFAESVRKVSTTRACELAAPVRGRALCVAVTRAITQTQFDEILTTFAPDVLQTEHDTLLKLHLPSSLITLPVYRAGEPLPETLPSRLLFEGPQSGTGEVCDWTQARQCAARTELVLAGGLHADNVAQAVAAVQPFGVDVSSGVEQRPGIKSPEKITAFVAAARTAHQNKVS